MVSIVHISDLHFGEYEGRSFEAAIKAINAIRPDCVIVSGDVTHGGRRAQFAAAMKMFDRIAVPLVGCPGNHDAPVFSWHKRALSPFARFNNLQLANAWDSACGLVSVRAINSARGLQARWDWSQGVYDPAAFAAAQRSFAHGARWRIIACHHPPHAPPSVAMRLKTRRAREAIARLHGAYTFLCGHVHARREFTAFDRPDIDVVTAPSLGSPRARGGGLGFLVLRFSNQRSIEEWRWLCGAFRPVSECAASAPAARSAPAAPEARRLTKKTIG
jgi:3',5'-cyclic AMP phosphodiesterase CpdA